jgi:tRNA(Ile2) C34 agmatinyltransferase TiaS
MYSKRLKPGDVVPASGIYLIHHDNLHRIQERELYLEGNRLPACAICGNAVRYELHAPCVPYRPLGMAALAAA